MKSWNERAMHTLMKGDNAFKMRKKEGAMGNLSLSDLNEKKKRDTNCTKNKSIGDKYAEIT